MTPDRSIALRTDGYIHICKAGKGEEVAGTGRGLTYWDSAFCVPDASRRLLFFSPPFSSLITIKLFTPIP